MVHFRIMFIFFFRSQNIETIFLKPCIPYPMLFKIFVWKYRFDWSKHRRLWKWKLRIEKLESKAPPGILGNFSQHIQGQSLNCTFILTVNSGDKKPFLSVLVEKIRAVENVWNTLFSVISSWRLLQVEWFLEYSYSLTLWIFLDKTISSTSSDYLLITTKFVKYTRNSWGAIVDSKFNSILWIISYFWI